VAKKRGRPKKEEEPMPDQSPPQKQQAPPPQQPQPAQQPAQGQPQPSARAPQLAAQHQQALAAAGLDWGRIQNLPWAQIIALIQILLQSLQGKQPTP
jgi:hypothetical protein